MESIGGALAALATREPITVCATTGHGELPIAVSDPTSADWRVVADRLRGEGMTVEELAAGDSVTAHCTVLVVAGPVQPFAPAEALAIQTYLRGGGALLDREKCDGTKNQKVTRKPASILDCDVVTDKTPLQGKCVRI